MLLKKYIHKVILNVMHFNEVAHLLLKRCVNSFMFICFLMIFSILCICIFSTDVYAKDKVIERWQTKTSFTEITGVKLHIFEAVYKDKRFFDSVEIFVGCRFSAPNPAMYIRLPDLTTDIMEPNSPATIQFADTIKNLDKASSLNAIVSHGDVVLLPNTIGDENNLSSVYDLFKANEGKSVRMLFTQNRRVYKYKLELAGFSSAFESAISSCKEVGDAQDMQKK